MVEKGNEKEKRETQTKALLFMYLYPKKKNRFLGPITNLFTLRVTVSHMYITPTYFKGLLYLFFSTLAIFPQQLWSKGHGVTMANQADSKSHGIFRGRGCT